jgi:hypothetical protein
MRRPYLAHLAEVDEVQCWLVDGCFIRNHRDVDFTNGAHALTRSYIPRNQVWIDREADGAGELRFLIAHLVQEHALMNAGMPYLRALERANRTERRLRRGALTNPALKGEAARARVRKTLIGTLAVPRGDARRNDGRTQPPDQVWIVDGRGVRDRFDPNFTQGGHGLRYRFVPRREIWIDDAISERELEPTLGHEAHELALMREGWSYYDAHDSALAFEKKLRARLVAMNRSYAKLQYGALLGKLCNFHFISY